MHLFKKLAVFGIALCFVAGLAGSAFGLSAYRDELISGNWTFQNDISFLGDITTGGTLELNGVEYTWPAADGTNGQQITTDGAGTLSWAAAGAACPWDDIANPDNNKAIDFTNYYTSFDSGDTDHDMFTFQGTGAFGDVSIVKIEQVTGDPTDGTVLEVVSADADADALLVTANAVDVILVNGDGTLTLTGNTDLTGDFDLTGDITVSGTWSVDAIAAATATQTLTLDGDTTGGVTIGATSTGNVILGDDVVVSDGYNATVGEGSLTIDNDAVDETALTITSDATTTGGAIAITSGVTTTTGKAVSVVADDLTTGDMLYLESSVGGLTTGNYIRCYDGAADDFEVGKYGAVIIAGNASTDILTITAGDIQITAGDIDLDNGQLMVDTNQDLANNISRDFAGAGTGPVLTVKDDNTASTNQALYVLQDGTAATAVKIDQTGTGNSTGIDLNVYGDYPAIDIDAGAARDGDVIDILMTNMVDERALNITGGITGTAGEGVIEVHTTGNIASTATLLRLDADTGTPAGTQGFLIYVDDDSGAQANAYAVEINSENNEALKISKGLLTVTENAVFTAGITDNGSSSLGDAVTDGLTINSAIQGASPLILDGGTDDTAETTIAVTDPSTDNTITLPDYSGSVPIVIQQGYTQTSQAGAGTSDVTGSLVTLADGWFVEGSTLKYTVVGTVVGANAAPSVALYLEDGAVCTLTCSNGAAGDWQAEFIVIATASNAQRITGRLVAEGGAELITDYATDNTDISAVGTIPVKLQITSGNAGDTITSEMVSIEYWLKAD